MQQLDYDQIAIMHNHLESMELLLSTPLTKKESAGVVGEVERLKYFLKKTKYQYQ